MNNYQKVLENRIQKLSDIISEKNIALKNVPEGTLRVSGRNQYAQYYIRQSSEEKNGTYLSVKEIDLARNLAQKDYDLKTLHAAEQELKLLLRLQKQVSNSCYEKIYPSMSKHRQQLIDPAELPDAEFLRQWKAQTYIPKPFADDIPEHFTSLGERVRSKSEVLIANTLLEMNIPYFYEKPLFVGNRIFHPDFTLLQLETRKTVFLEHFGMMNDPEYAETAVSKIHYYIRHDILPGDRLLLTFETKNLPLNIRILKAQLKSFFDSDSDSD